MWQADSREKRQCTANLSRRAAELGLRTNTAGAGANPTQGWPCIPSAVGNQALLRSLSVPRPAVQAKLTVNQPGDPYEQEADRVADQVMRMPDSNVAVAAPAFSGALRRHQRQCACGGSGGNGGMCAECAEEEKLHRAAASPAPVPEAPAIVHDVLRSPGNPLDPQTQAFFEARFGADFSRVRVHTDARAAQSAAAVNALAYTTEEHIAFAADQYAPRTSAGRKLLAHELTHVLQQRFAA